MKNELIELFPREAQEALRTLKEHALPAAEMFAKHGDVAVIPCNVLNDHLALFPLVAAFQRLKKELANPQLSKKARAKIEKRLEKARSIESLTPLLAKDGLDPGKLFKIFLRIVCTDVLPLTGANELCIRASRVIPNIDRIREIEKEQQISLEQFDLSDFKDFDFDLLEDADKAENFPETETILPLSIYCYFFTVVQLLASLHVFSERIAVAKSHGKEREELIQATKSVNDTLEQVIVKYPFLRGKPQHDIDRLILEFYTRPASEIVEMFGPEEICFPYEVPEEMKNSPFNPQNN